VSNEDIRLSVLDRDGGFHRETGERLSGSNTVEFERLNEAL